MTTHKTVASRALLIAVESERVADAYALAADDAWMSGLEDDAVRLRGAADALRDQAGAVRAELGRVS